MVSKHFPRIQDCCFFVPCIINMTRRASLPPLRCYNSTYLFNKETIFVPQSVPQKNCCATCVQTSVFLILHPCGSLRKLGTPTPGRFTYPGRCTSTCFFCTETGTSFRSFSMAQRTASCATWDPEAAVSEFPRFPRFQKNGIPSLGLFSYFTKAQRMMLGLGSRPTSLLHIVCSCIPAPVQVIGQTQWLLDLSHHSAGCVPSWWVSLACPRVRPQPNRLFRLRVWISRGPRMSWWPFSLSPSIFLFLVVWPGAPSSVLAPSSDALCS